MATETVAVTALEELGLTEYEARCYVALARVPKGTAKEISQVADVPRSRVYDTVDRLHGRGLVDVQQSDPRTFRAVPTGEALDVLRRTYDASIQKAGAALDELETVNSDEGQGVWAVENAEHVTNRAVALVDDAEERVHVLVATEGKIGDDLREKLAEVAGEGGVSVLIEAPTADRREELADGVPDARVVRSRDLAETSAVVDKWPGKLLLVDGHAVLASGVQEGELPGVQQETAVWSSGPDHGLATWMQELVSDRPASCRDGDQGE